MTLNNYDDNLAILVTFLSQCHIDCVSLPLPICFQSFVGDADNGNLFELTNLAVHGARWGERDMAGQ